jgi:CheY-like chemotaxis protein/HPt (histidine-containing phosphotransfer) domain-containing protein
MDLEAAPADLAAISAPDGTVPVYAPSSGESPAPANAPAGTGGKPLVLIVEDNPVNQNLFAMIIGKLGYPTVTADDGLDALEKAAVHPVSFVFMDIQMPRMNGYEAAKELRKRGFKRPVIAVTASALADEREHCIKAGFDDILIKPFKRPDIEKMLLAWIAKPLPSEAAPLPPVNPDPPPDSSLTPKGHSTIHPPPSSLTEPLPPPPSVFDPKDLRDTFMAEDEMIVSMLAKFIARTGEQIEQSIPQAAEAEDWETARREAHTIKGAAFTMSGKELGTAAARLETAFKTIDRDEMAAALPPVKEAFIRFKAAAEQYLRQEPPR